MTENKCKGKLLFKLFLLIILPLFISSCHRDLYKNTKLRIAEIDKLNIDEEIIEILSDSLGNSFDTLSIVTTKRNKHGQIVYEKIIREDELEINYLLPNKKLFYQTINLKAGKVKTILKSKLNKEGLVTENAFIYINESTNERDTMISFYKYNFDANNRKKSLTISQNIKGNESVEVITYNNLEQPISELRIAGNDTLEFKQHYINTEGILEKTMILYPNYMSINTIQTTRFFYPNGELMLFEKYLFTNNENKELLTMIKYELNEEYKMAKSIHNYISEGKKEYRNYIYSTK